MGLAGGWWGWRREHSHPARYGPRQMPTVVGVRRRPSAREAWTLNGPGKRPRCLNLGKSRGDGDGKQVMGYLAGKPLTLVL